jgi:hypothetical protein
LSEGSCRKAKDGGGEYQRRPHHHFPFLNPISTSRRNASDRVVSFAAAQASTSVINAGGMRAAI